MKLDARTPFDPKSMTARLHKVETVFDYFLSFFLFLVFSVSVFSEEPAIHALRLLMMKLFLSDVMH